MDRPERPEQTEPSSIFSKPDPFDDLTPPRSPLARESTLDPGDVSTWRPPAPSLRDAYASRSDEATPIPSGGRGPSRRLLIGIAAASGGAVLVMSYIAFSILGNNRPPVLAADDPSPTPSASLRAEPTLAPTQEPTPEPTPAGPPMEMAVGDWARVMVEGLRVRAGAGADQDALYRLTRGSIVTVADGPQVVGGGNWYRVASIGGAVGWVSSGWVARPNLEAIVNAPVLIHCGEAGTHPIFGIVDGVAQPRDVLRIGALAFPTNKLNESTLATIELARGIGAEVCVTAQVGSDGLPFLQSELNASACGHAVPDGELFWLYPAAGQDADVSSQIKTPALVHPVLLSGPADSRQTSNLRAIVTMMSSEGAAGCVVSSTNLEGGTLRSYHGATVAQCSVVEEYNDQNLKLRPAAGGPTAWIRLPKDGSPQDEIPLGKPIEVWVSTDVNPDGINSWAGSSYNYDREECA